MDTIELLPHHARNVLMAYKGRSPGDGIAYYDNSMQETDVANIRAILENPNQKVRIVSGLDSLCNSCPHNKFGTNYDPNENKDYCEIGSGKVDKMDDSWWAEELGLHKHIDGQPIDSTKFLDTMKKNFKISRTFANLGRRAIKKLLNYQ